MSPPCLNNSRDKSVLARHRAGPFAEERERYLQQCAEDGATRGVLRMKANKLLWLCQHPPRDASQGINLPELQEIARKSPRGLERQFWRLDRPPDTPNYLKIRWAIRFSGRELGGNNPQ